MILNIQDIHTLFHSFSNIKALVIGDLMTDAYMWGTVDRISPEAPVPVIQVTKREERPGGAANVALNLISLGAKVAVAGAIGNDDIGNRLDALLTDAQIDATPSTRVDRPTTCKTRIIGGSQQMLRVDEEDTAYLSHAEEEDLLRRISNHILNGVDLIIFEDYNKGVLSSRVISTCIDLANKHGIITAVDPKFRNFMAYKHVTLFKPNLKELRQGLNMDIDYRNEDDLIKASNRLFEELHCDHVLITLSELGIYVRDGQRSIRIPAHQREIADVSGAGDTVISIASVCLAAGTSVEFAGALSNIGGGLVCESVGVVPIHKERLLSEAIKIFGA